MNFSNVCVWISKSENGKGIARLHRINQLFLDKAVCIMRRLSELIPRLPMHTRITPVKSVFFSFLFPASDYPLLFTSILHQRWERGPAFLCRTLKETVPKWYLQVHLCGWASVEVDWGHSLIHWRMYSKAWQWGREKKKKQHFKSWIIVDTLSAESLQILKRLCCVILFSRSALRALSSCWVTTHHLVPFIARLLPQIGYP